MKPGSKEFVRRQARWQHNSFLGHVAMGKGQMRSIIRARTTSQDAKQIAQTIDELLDLLQDYLKKRIDK